MYNTYLKLGKHLSNKCTKNFSVYRNYYIDGCMNHTEN